MRPNLKTVAMMVLLVSCATSFAQSRYPVSNPTSKEFTFTGRYHYIERDYTPAVVITRVAESPKTVQSAEEALISQFSAVDALDYDWWLSTFDAAAQKQMAVSTASVEAAKKDWLQDWKTKAGKLNVKLTRWMISGQYVILAYTLSSTDQKVTGTLPEYATAFRLWDGNWRATLDLQGDPVLLHFADTKTRFERVVRP